MPCGKPCVTPRQWFASRGEGGSGLTGAELLKSVPASAFLECNDGKASEAAGPLRRWRVHPFGGPALGLRGGGQRPQPCGCADTQGHSGIPPEVRPAQQPARARLHPAGRPTRPLQKAASSVATQPRPTVGIPLAADVRYWGNWMLERGAGRAGRVLPAGPRRQRACGLPMEPHHPMPQLSCAEMPLIRQYWLARRTHSKRVSAATND